MSKILLMMAKIKADKKMGSWKAIWVLVVVLFSVFEARAIAPPNTSVGRLTTHLYNWEVDSAGSTVEYSNISGPLYTDVSRVAPAPNVLALAEYHLVDVLMELKFKKEIESSPSITLSCASSHVFLNSEDFHISKVGKNLYLSMASRSDGFQFVRDNKCWKLVLSDQSNELRSGKIQFLGMSTIEGNLDFWSRDFYKQSRNRNQSFSTKGHLHKIDPQILLAEKSEHDLAGYAVSSDEKNLIIGIHGWNRTNVKNPYAPSSVNDNVTSSEVAEQIAYPGYDEKGSWGGLFYRLFNNPSVKSDNWVIARYDWARDAASVFPNNAIVSSIANGKRLAGQIISIYENSATENSPLKIQFIGHSAGSWLVRTATDAIKAHFGNRVIVGVELLDAYIPGDDKYAFSKAFGVGSNFNYLTPDEADLVSFFGTYSKLPNGFTNILASKWDAWAISLYREVLKVLGEFEGLYNVDLLPSHSGILQPWAMTAGELVSDDRVNSGFKTSLVHNPRSKAPEPISRVQVEPGEYPTFNYKLSHAIDPYHVLGERGECKQIALVVDSEQYPISCRWDSSSFTLTIAAARSVPLNKEGKLFFGDHIKDYFGNTLNPALFNKTFVTLPPDARRSGVYFATWDNSKGQYLSAKGRKNVSWSNFQIVQSRYRRPVATIKVTPEHPMEPNDIWLSVEVHNLSYLSDITVMKDTKYGWEEAWKFTNNDSIFEHEINVSQDAKDSGATYFLEVTDVSGNKIRTPIVNVRYYLDTDKDGLGDERDNCPFRYNPAQEDLDKDGRGNACDSDIDNDGVSNSEELNIGTDPYLADSDGDGLNDGTDPNPISATDNGCIEICLMDLSLGSHTELPLRTGSVLVTGKLGGLGANLVKINLRLGDYYPLQATPDENGEFQIKLEPIPTYGNNLILSIVKGDGSDVELWAGTIFRSDWARGNTNPKLILHRDDITLAEGQAALISGKAEDKLNVIPYILVNIDGAGWQVHHVDTSKEQEPLEWEVSLEDLSVGEHVVEIMAQDEFGADSAIRVAYITVLDTDTPQISLTSEKDITFFKGESEVTICGEAFHDSGIAAIEVNLNGTHQWYSNQVELSPWCISNYISSGRNELKVRAQSTSGVYSSPASLIVYRTTVSSQAKQMDLGENHSVFLTADGHLKVAGSNFYGQLGLGQDVVETLLHTKIDMGSERFIAVAACGNRSFAISRDNFLYAWGENTQEFPLGTNSEGNIYLPTKVDSEFKWASVRCSNTHVVGQQHEKMKMLGFGGNYYGQLYQSNEVVQIPVLIDPMRFASRKYPTYEIVEAGDGFTVWQNRSHMYIVGKNDKYQAGTGSNGGPVGGRGIYHKLMGAQRAAVGPDHISILRKNRSRQIIRSWGRDHRQSSESYIKKPTKTFEYRYPLLDICSGRNFTLSIANNLDENGNIRRYVEAVAAGNNGHGQLAFNRSRNFDWLRMNSIKNHIFTQVACGDRSASLRVLGRRIGKEFVKSGNDVLVFGDNSAGQLGTGSKSERQAPVLISLD